VCTSQLPVNRVKGTASIGPRHFRVQCLAALTCYHPIQHGTSRVRRSVLLKNHESVLSLPRRSCTAARQGHRGSLSLQCNTPFAASENRGSRACTSTSGKLAAAMGHPSDRPIARFPASCSKILLIRGTQIILCRYSQLHTDIRYQRVPLHEISRSASTMSVAEGWGMTGTLVPYAVLVQAILDALGIFPARFGSIHSLTSILINIGLLVPCWSVPCYQLVRIPVPMVPVR
jgi:hypothetical protein